MTIAEAKRNYNKLLERYYRAEEYFDKKNIPQSEKESQLGNFNKVLEGLNYYLNKIGSFEDENIMGGFDVR